MSEFLISLLSLVLSCMVMY